MSITTKSLINLNVCLEVPQQQSFTFQIQCPEQSRINSIFAQIFFVLFKNKSAASALSIFTHKDKSLDSSTQVVQNETYYSEITKEKYDELVANMQRQDNKQLNAKKQVRPQKLEPIEKKQNKNQEQKVTKPRKDVKQKKQMEQKGNGTELIDINSNREKDPSIHNITNKNQEQNKNQQQNNTQVIHATPLNTTPASTSESCCQLI